MSPPHEPHKAGARGWQRRASALSLTLLAHKVVASGGDKCDRLGHMRGGDLLGQSREGHERGLQRLELAPDVLEPRVIGLGRNGRTGA